MAHQFFHGFIPQQDIIEGEGNTTSALTHNLMAMEIYNNWQFALELFERSIGQETVEVNLIEKDWLVFLNKNNINIKSYENKEDFIEKNLKPLVKEDK